MKKYLIILFACVPLLVSANFDKDLYYGMKGDSQIQELQEFLTNRGFYSGPITGNFFSLTLKAVKSFQTAQSIISTGYFGRLTRGKVNALLESAGVTSTGITNESVIISNPSITTPKSGDNVVTKLNEQIKVLMDQLAELKKNKNTLTQQNQTLQTIQQQQASTTAQIAQHMALLASPVPTPSPTPVPMPSPIIIYVTPQPISEVDKSDIIVKTDKTTFPASGFHYANFTVTVLDKTGKSSEALIKIHAPDNMPNQNPPEPNPDDREQMAGIIGYENPTTNTGTIWGVVFGYRSIKTGTKKITFTSGNLSKSITIDVIPYVPIDSVVQDVVKNPLIQSVGGSGSIGSFKLSAADESTNVAWIYYDTNVPDSGNNVYVYCDGGNRCSYGNNAGMTHTIGIIVQAGSGRSIPTGNYTLTITKIDLVGMQSGSYRSISGLPITFTFEVK